MDTDERGPINDGAWSPDSRWIAYGKSGANLSSALYLYSVENKKATKVTSGFYNDGNPVFDPDGKYLFFTSPRVSISRPPVLLEQRFNYFNTTGIFALTLKADEVSPFAPQSDEEKPPEEASRRCARDAAWLLHPQAPLPATFGCSRGHSSTSRDCRSRNACMANRQHRHPHKPQSRSTKTNPD